MTPKSILNEVRRLLDEHSCGDPDKLWYARRYVFQRLHLEERAEKSVIKKELLAGKPRCHFCKRDIKEKRGGICLPGQAAASMG